MKLSERFSWGSRTYVMGILNATPDSFSGDGLLASGGPGPATDGATGPGADRVDDPETVVTAGLEAGGAIDPGTDRMADAVSRAVAVAGAFLEAGADILDVGGASTRPGATAVDPETETGRVQPVVAALREAYPEAAISIDTSNADTAAATLDAGADIINDVWALQADPRMSGLAAERGAPVILMHNRSRPACIGHPAGGHGTGRYADVVGDVRRDLLGLAEVAERAGVARGQIILDPGIGFGKSPKQNLALIDGIGALREAGYPVLVGASRKSFVARVLGSSGDAAENASQTVRDEGSLTATVLAITRGADIVRVHDVAPTVRAARMADAVATAGRSGRSRS